VAPHARSLTKPLIIGDIADEHVAAVVERLAACGASATIVDTAKLETGFYRVVDSWAEVDDDIVDFRRPRQGWIRRLAPPHWRRRTQGATEDAAIRSAWSSLLVGFAGDASVRWLTTIEPLFFLENKLLQLRIAERLRIRTPRSAVVPEQELIPPELGDDLVVKPLGVGHFTGSDDVEMVVYATSLQRGAPELSHLGPAPFLIQERLNAECHLRVVTVNQRAWACELKANCLPLDWRSDESAHHAFVPVDHARVRSSALAIAEAAKLGYSSQDWIVQDGEPYFVDLNPAGQWLFLPEPVASEVSAEIAAWLMSPAE
jgi:hypothetical protein